ncbi:hypothetical protein T08_663 [Trichinella sp. T8]|nr:hypothetical protein T08_663 [Trichinella sp. T8]
MQADIVDTHREVKRKACRSRKVAELEQRLSSSLLDTAIKCDVKASLLNKSPNLFFSVNAVKRRTAMMN